MNIILIDEPHLQLSPTLARKLGLNEALVLQQLHFHLQKSPLKYDGYTWYNHTYYKWQKQFPFWSEKTISRIFLNLEKEKIIVSTQKYNPIKTYKTKFYRIDYDVLKRIIEETNEDSVEGKCDNESQNDRMNTPDSADSSGQISFSLQDNHGALKIEENKEKKNRKSVEKNLDLVAEVIHYLNRKTNRNYRENNQSTQRLINARLRDGYTLEDFKKVIDVKVAQWKKDPKMNQYLRPSTLFNPTNFENYLMESRERQTNSKGREIKPIELDFTLGEEDD